jgi:hypothetical protein
MAVPFILYANLADATGAVLTASSTATGYDVNNLKDRNPATFWKSTGGATEWIKIDMGAASSRYIDAIGITSHNLFTQTISGITLEWSTDDVTYSSVGVFSFSQAPMDLRGDRTWLQGGTNSVAGTPRYWRITFSSCDAAIQIACLCAGEKLAFTEYMDQGFDPDSISLANRFHQSRGGQYVGGVVEYAKQHIELKFGPAGLSTTAFFDTYGTPSWDDFIRTTWARGKPFWFKWGGEPTSIATNSVTRSGWYCWPAANAKTSSPYQTSVRRGWKFGFEALAEGY